MAISKITTSGVSADTLTAADLAPNSVDSSELVDGSIDTAHIGDDQVTADKLANSINTDIATGVAALPKAGGTMTGAITGMTALTGGTGDLNWDSNTLVVDSSESRVGIGTLTPQEALHINVAGVVQARLQSTTANTGAAIDLWTDGGNATQRNWRLQNNHAIAGTFAFLVGASAGADPSLARMVIAENGNVGIGLTNPSSLLHVKDSASGSTVVQVIGGTNKKFTINGGGSYGFQIDGTNGGAITFCNRTGNGQHFLFYKDGNSGGGNITQTGASVAFNTSSDYRMKENIVSLDNALNRLVQLKPSRFNFIGEEETRDGFIAHEVSSLVPEAVTGEKDATEDRIDIVLNSDGTVCRESVSEEDWTAGKDSGEYASNTTWEATKKLPSYQSIDQAKLVPLLVGAIQELSAKVIALENA